MGEGDDNDGEEEKLSTVDARRSMTRRHSCQRPKEVAALAQTSTPMVDSRQPTRHSPSASDQLVHNKWSSGQHHDGATSKDINATIEKVIMHNDAKRHTSELAELEERGMVKSNQQITVLLVVHKGDETHNLFMDVIASIQYSELKKQVAERCGTLLRPGATLRMAWLDPDDLCAATSGEVVDLTSATWRHYLLAMWCSLPWEIHVLPEGGGKGGGKGQKEATFVQHSKIARVLFEKYDVNRNGRLDKVELARVLCDLHLERYDCSPELQARFVDNQFLKLDTDGSGSMSLDEFTKYVSSMTSWTRNELLSDANENQVFELLAGRAMEVTFPPTALPHPVDLGDLRGPVSVIDTECFGIRLESPEGALPVGMNISLRTLFRGAISYLSEVGFSETNDSQQPIANYDVPCSPIIRLDAPAFMNGNEPPALGSEPSAPFPSKVTLIMPHCFDPREGMESVVVLGAAHGATNWEPILSDDVEMKGQEMHVKVSHAGIFAAFSKYGAAETCVARFHVFTMAEVPRDEPTSLRIQVCPEIPNVLQEMELAESSIRGLSECAGASHVLYLTKGMRFRISFHGQEEELTWVGMREEVEFTIPATGSGGRPAADGDPDERDVLDGFVTVDVLEGIGKRAMRPRACAKRAGMPESGMRIPYALRLKENVRANPPVLWLLERTAHYFTVEWREPALVDGDGDGVSERITHYEIQIATTSPNGTYYDWQELWFGPAHVSPDFAMMVAEKSDEDAWAQRLREARVSGSTRNAAPPADKRGKSKSRKAAKKAEAPASAPAEAPASAKPITESPPFSYTCYADPQLFGRLRIRCWSEGEERPSMYSKNVSLPRCMGKGDDEEMKLQMVREARADYYSKLTQHVTCTKGALTRIGNKASNNKWGGDPLVPPPPPTAKELVRGDIMAPVPYDVPRLPTGIVSLNEAGNELAQFFREKGVRGGGGGRLFGLTIDHVLQAIVGSLNSDGEPSPGRTDSTLREPLMALCEVAYADALLPLFDDAEVAKAQWQFVDERVYGVVARITWHRDHYLECRSHVKDLLGVMIELYELVRQCQAERVITFHITHPDYEKSVRRTLMEELTTKMRKATWQLSVELLEMQLKLGLRRAQDDYIAASKAAAERSNSSPNSAAGNRTKKRLERALIATRSSAFLQNAGQGSPAPERTSRSRLRKASMASLSLSLALGMRERGEEADERVRYEMQLATNVLLRARRVGQRLRKRLQPTSISEIEEEAPSVDVNCWKLQPSNDQALDPRKSISHFRAASRLTLLRSSASCDGLAPSSSTASAASTAHTHVPLALSRSLLATRHVNKWGRHTHHPNHALVHAAPKTKVRVLDAMRKVDDSVLAEVSNLYKLPSSSYDADGYPHQEHPGGPADQDQSAVDVHHDGYRPMSRPMTAPLARASALTASAESLIQPNAFLTELPAHSGSAVLPSSPGLVRHRTARGSRRQRWTPTLPQSELQYLDAFLEQPRSHRHPPSFASVSYIPAMKHRVAPTQFATHQDKRAMRVRAIMRTTHDR